MSANDQRPKGQPSQVSNGNKEEDAYMQQPPHPMRAWSEQANDGGYGAGPMSTAVSDSFFPPSYYPPNMSYPFMSQGMGGSEGAWSNGADTMFGMGYDYSNMYSGFGFPFNWDYSGDYWGNTQPVRKDQRGYAAEDAYYPQEIIQADSYGMVNGAGPPPDTQQEPVANVEQGIRNMRLAYRKDEMIPQQQQQQPPHPQQHQHQQQQQQQKHHLQQVVAEGFGGDPSLMMPPSPVSASAPSMNVRNSGGGGDQAVQSSKKTSWAAIASQPARPQLQMRPRTIPRAPVHPSKTHSMDIGTWDTRGNPSRVPLASQPPPLASYSRQPLINQRQAPLPSSANVTISSSSGNNASAKSTLNSNSSSYSGPVVNVNSSSGNNNNNNSSNMSGSANSHSDNATTVSSDNNNSMSSSGGNSSTPYSGYSNASGNQESNNRAVVTVNASVNGSHAESQAPAPVVESNSTDKSSNLYNPKEFVLNHKSARYFIIKSYSEDDIHRSIKYSVWCSTDHGNRRLDAAFREREGKGPVYLIFSVNGSGHFCGVAQMMSPVDYNKSTGIWHQDKWKGQIEVKWVYVKDVPNGQLRHIRLENNDNKPVTNSRDTQEVPPEKGKQVLRILHSYKNTTSIFDDFSHYEKRQEEDRMLTIHKDNRGGGDRDNRGGGDRDNRGGGDREYHGNHQRDQRGGDHRGGDHRGDRGDRENSNRGGRDNDHHYRNDYRGDGRDQRYDGRGDNRNDNRDRHRAGFDREIRARPGGMNDRDNRRGPHRQN